MAHVDELGGVLFFELDGFFVEFFIMFMMLFGRTMKDPPLSETNNCILVIH